MTIISLDESHCPTSERQKGYKLMKPLSNYVVFDLETSSRYVTNCEIIEISALRVRNNAVVEQFSSLVRPNAPISDEIVTITGITNDMVSSAPELRPVLSEFLKFVGTDPVVGHNINSFDINIVYDFSMRLFNKPFSNDFSDTLYLSHCLLHDVPNYKLSTICRVFQVSTAGAHRSLNDCFMNYQCYEKMKEILTATGATCFPSTYCSSPKQSFNDEALTLLIEVFGKKIALTGDFGCAPRDALSKFLERNGAICMNSISKHTDYLVLGSLGSKVYKPGTHGCKHEKALELQEIGEKIKILNECEVFQCNHN